ncbi:MAG TPA: DUF5678 domain-containing protein [Pyrinomonadaceae bacterium]|nr:DUF5678 domain-containing protein [Pyrinomonadaceae bacterium]
MTLTVNVPEELESKLEEEAKRSGVSKDEFVRIVLEERLNFKPGKPNFPSKIIATDVPARDFSATREWLEKHRDEYDGQYVALDGDKLIAAGFDAKEVARKARESGINGLFVGYVEGSNHPPFISGGLWRE